MSRRAGPKANRNFAGSSKARSARERRGNSRTRLRSQAHQRHKTRTRPGIHKRRLDLRSVLRRLRRRTRRKTQKTILVKISNTANTRPNGVRQSQSRAADAHARKGRARRRHLQNVRQPDVNNPSHGGVIVKNTSTVAAKKLKLTDKLPPNWEYVGEFTFAGGEKTAPKCPVRSNPARNSLGKRTSNSRPAPAKR